MSLKYFTSARCHRMNEICIPKNVNNSKQIERKSHKKFASAGGSSFHWVVHSCAEPSTVERVFAPRNHSCMAHTLANQTTKQCLTTTTTTILSKHGTMNVHGYRCEWIDGINLFVASRKDSNNSVILCSPEQIVCITATRWLLLCTSLCWTVNICNSRYVTTQRRVM